MRWTTGVTERPTISDLGLDPGKKARLFRILFQHGLCNGTALFLPYDQGLEHGPQDFFANPAAVDPAYVTKLAVEAGFNGIVLNIGLAEEFYRDFAGEVPLILKVKFPHPEKRAGVPAGYDDDFSPQQAMEAVVRSANRTLVLVSGGSMAGDEATLEKARQSLEAGATGLIFGRNIWQREHDESLRLIGKLQEILVKHPGYSIAFWERRHGSFGENMIFPS